LENKHGLLVDKNKLLKNRTGHQLEKAEEFLAAWRFFMSDTVCVCVGG
jgi:hypothetical protein